MSNFHYIDSSAEADQLEVMAEGIISGDVHNIPAIDSHRDFHVDKNRDAPAEAGQSIQYAFFVHENRFVELDYKSEQEYKADFHGFAKV